MDQIRIRGGNRLDGVIHVSGAKNAALPLMAASMLTDDVLTLSNLPALADIETMASLLRQHGVRISTDVASANGAGRTMSFDASGVNETTAPYDLVRQMRASVLVLAPLVARFGEAPLVNIADHHTGALFHAALRGGKANAAARGSGDQNILSE